MDRPLQLITYLVPSHPVELYECVAHYLEDELGVHATLSYESRDPVQLFGRHPNPFVYGHADIGFLSPMQYVKIKNLSAKRFELLPVSPVFVHPKNKAKKPGYYSDIIMHADFEKTVKSFIDLRGSNWAYTRDHSLSSSLTIRKLLRSFGENSTFFGNTKMTENHLLSVKMVQDKQVTAAAVDSVAFYNYKNVLHKDSEDIRVFDSIGPHPPYAVVCSKTLPVELKTKIINALFTISLKQTWADKFEKFGLIKFAVNSDDSYTDLGFTETTESNRGLSSVYY